MPELLTFPDSDDARLEQVCQDLCDIIFGDLEAHCALLRAIQASRSESPPPSEWIEENTRAILSRGLYGACREGLVSTTLLQQLAHDPDLLVRLAPRILEDGAIEHWQPSAALTHAADVDSMAGELLDALRVHESQAGDANQPTIESSDLREPFEGRWMTRPAGPTCRIDVPIVAATTLTLRWAGRTWGKLRVERRSAVQMRLAARTGVFLAYPLPAELTVRAAAKIPAQDVRRVGIEISAVRDGVIVEISP